MQVFVLPIYIYYKVKINIKMFLANTTEDIFQKPYIYFACLKTKSSVQDKVSEIM